MKRFLLLLIAATCACGAPFGGGALESLEPPPPASTYSTAARPNGVRGGKPAEDLAVSVEKLLAQRGDDPEPDGALGALCIWLLREAYAGRGIDSPRVDAMARRFGFPGVLYSSATLSVDGEAEQRLKELFALPQNQRVTRYGIATGNGGREAAVVVGAVEASLSDFPRSIAPGGTIRLDGEVAKRFDRASVIVTGSDGSTRELPMAARRIGVSLKLDRPGAFMVEVMGFGRDGPTVVVNVPVYVGVAEQDVSPAGATPVDPTLTPERVEARLLELLGEARQKNGALPLTPDAELRAVALAHSLDMAQNDFFGHVSPATGTPEDRIRRAAVVVSLAGENVGAAATPEEIHQSLLGSPGHRANMLRPGFTHIGIGVATREHAGRRLFLATQIFGRRPPAAEARLTAPSIVEAIQSHRAARGLPPARVDPALSAAADAGIRALVSGTAKSQEQALGVAQGALASHARRTRQNRPAGCATFVEILERAQLAEVPLLVDARVATFGVGASTFEGAGAPRLGVLMLLEGTFQTPLKCK